MYHQALLADLEKKGRQQAEAIQRQARETVDRLREEAARTVEEQRQHSVAQKTAACDALKNSLLQEGRRQAEKAMIIAEHRLAERLLKLAGQILDRLRGNNYDAVFDALVAELPDCPWQTIRVSEKDRELAARHFPTADIVGDDSISGGFIAQTADQTIVIDNSFETRLQRAWPDLLPDLLHTALLQVEDHASAS